VSIIPQHIVAKIIETARIEEVVGDFVNLKRRGANYHACCPFHNEKTPSFNVSPTKNIFKCFGCGKAGSPASFIMLHEKMAYYEALRYLANKYQIEIPDEIDPSVLEAEKQAESLYIVNTFAANYFANYLQTDPEGQTLGLSYFNERGFTNNDVVKQFQLGFSPDNFDSFLHEAQQKGYSVDLLQKAGLVSEKNGKVFPFFRGRVIFPIQNLSGKVVAFAGRTLHSAQQPKYLNTPETAIYHKGNLLYGLYQARQSIRQKDQCILVEGYTDVLSLRLVGIENAVASSGTSLTTEQSKLIKRFTNNVLILFDGDNAGVKAALRGIDILLEDDLDVRVLLLPDGEDPDSFAKKNGRMATEAYLTTESADFIRFKTNLLLTEAAGDPIKTSGVISNVLQSVALIPNSIKRSLYIREAAARFKMDEQIVISEVNKFRLQHHTHKQQKSAANQTQIHPNSTTEAAADANKTISLALDQPTAPADTPVQNDRANNRLERELLRELFEYGAELIQTDVPLAAYIINEIIGLPFNNDQYNKIIDIYCKLLEKGQLPTRETLSALLDEEHAQTLAEIANLVGTPSENWRKLHKIELPNIDKFQIERTLEIINRFKIDYVGQLMNNKLDELKTLQNIEAENEIIQAYQELMTWQKELAKATKEMVIVR
jgi:DNA primase